MEEGKRSRIPIEKILLATIASVGLIAAVALAPAAGPALRVFGFGKKRYSNRYIQNTISRMKQKGYITFQEKNGKKYLRITNTGKKRLEQYRANEISIPKQKKWDNIWRIVIFDIPEKKRVQREKIRRTLIAVGFMQLQKSVWIYPYPCEEVVKLLKADEHIGKNVLYLEAKRVEYDKPIRTLFGI